MAMSFWAVLLSVALIFRAWVLVSSLKALAKST